MAMDRVVFRCCLGGLPVHFSLGIYCRNCVQKRCLRYLSCQWSAMRVEVEGVVDQVSF